MAARASLNLRGALVLFMSDEELKRRLERIEYAIFLIGMALMALAPLTLLNSCR